MTLTEGESKALLASALLVMLAALGRVALDVPPAQLELAGMGPAGDVDSALAVAESIYADGQRRRKSLAVGERIDPNKAGEAELDRLPGVGPSLARAIVVDRRTNGPFGTLADLGRVPGIGKSTLNRLAPHTTLRVSEISPPEPGRGPARAGRDGAVQPGPAPGRTTKLDLNRASADELIALPGIGATRAAAIVRWREQHGRFRNLDNLLQVPGLGPATLARMRPLVEIRP